MMGRKILFTGGGSSGHVTPNLALIEEFQKIGWDISYIGSKNGIEKSLIERESVPFYHIPSGKLRRHFAWKNFSDIFRVLLGIISAWILLGKIKPDIIFSKGGFVAFPVVFAGWSRKIPVIVHEADYSPGLSNKISFPFAKNIFISFLETEKYIKYKRKITLTGLPIRSIITKGNKEKALEFLGFSGEKPIITIFGGGLGAKLINDVVYDSLDILLAQYDIAHICGKGKVKGVLLDGYRQFEYLHDEFADLLAASSLVISRAGANSLFELAELEKPNILIPLSKAASRGEQLQNAIFAAKHDLSLTLPEEDLNKENLLAIIAQAMEKEWKHSFVKKNAKKEIIRIILNEVKK